MSEEIKKEIERNELSDDMLENAGGGAGNYKTGDYVFYKERTKSGENIGSGEIKAYRSGVYEIYSYNGVMVKVRPSDIIGLV
ncbi:MAG: hypothetical protein ACI4J1_06245 [Ruminiclostridium sp.]